MRHVGRSFLLAAAVGALALIGLAMPGAGASTRASRSSSIASGLGPVQHVSADGLSIGYRTGGHGPALIVVMGRSGTMADWDPLFIKQLSRDHKVVIFDNRGMGTTSFTGSPDQVTIPLMAKDALALASALHIARFDLLGWSMGGEIAQQMTVDAPSRVLALALCATSAGGPTEVAPSPTVEKTMSEPKLPTATLFKLSFPSTPAGRKGAVAYASRVALQYKIDHLPSDSFSETADGAAGQQHARTVWTSSSGGVANELPKLATKVLVMWGNKDVIDPPANDQLILKLLRHGTSKVFAGAGHAFLFQDAPKVGQAADAFFDAPQR